MGALLKDALNALLCLCWMDLHEKSQMSKLAMAPGYLSSRTSRAKNCVGFVPMRPCPSKQISCEHAEIPGGESAGWKPVMRNTQLLA
jgi:hypothetical protein